MKNVTELSSACDEKVVIMVSREGKVMCMNGNDEGMFVALQIKMAEIKTIEEDVRACKGKYSIEFIKEVIRKGGTALAEQK